MSAMKPSSSQRGVATVEFALVAMVFFTLLFGVLELARMLYVFNSVQEVTRRAAREAAVRWTSDGDKTIIKELALFGGSELPGGAAVNSAAIKIEYLRFDGNSVTTAPTSPADNLSACGDALRVDSCIYSVRVSVTGVTYVPLLSLFGFLNVQLPPSQVTMHAESMGFES
jgi:hypothetical protein